LKKSRAFFIDLLKVIWRYKTVCCFPELKGYGMKKIFMQMASVVFFFLYSFNSFAEIPPKLLQEMFPSKGFIIKVKDDSLLIDLDSKNGVKEGDIFTIFSPGETITHPVTKRMVILQPKGFPGQKR